MHYAISHLTQDWLPAEAKQGWAWEYLDGKPLGKIRLLLEEMLVMPAECAAHPVVCVGLKGIVHFEINCWYVLAYLNGIQDVGVFVSTVFSILTFLGQTILEVYGVYPGFTTKSIHREVKIKQNDS